MWFEGIAPCRFVGLANLAARIIIPLFRFHLARLWQVGAER
jgi:hypothetical protein